MSVQEKLPGVQSQFAHTPAEHVCDAPHAVVVEASPSGLHTWRLLPTQVALPGVQAQPPHIPVEAVQLFIAGHAVVAPYPRPSALHIRVPVVPTQLVAAGTQTRAMQTPAPQLSLDAHAVAV